MAGVGTKCPEIDGLKVVKGAADVKVPNIGKVTVIECWATWCGPCRQVFPRLTELQRKYGKSGLEIVGVTSEQSLSSSFLKGEGAQMDYTVAIDGDLEVQEKLLMPFRINGIPHAFVVGRDGVITFSGHPLDPGFERALVTALGAEKKKEEKVLRQMPAITASEQELMAMSVSQLKKILAERNVSTVGLLEKQEFVSTILKNCSKPIFVE